MDSERKSKVFEQRYLDSKCFKKERKNHRIKKMSVFKSGSNFIR